MKQELETTIEHAQKITIGQLDNGTLATAVNCAETLQIVRHGRVESYVIPKHLIDALLIENETLKWVEEKNQAIMEGDNEELERLREENKHLLGERVAESIEVPKSHFFNHDFKFDMGEVTKAAENIRNAAAKIRLEGVFKRSPANAKERAMADMDAVTSCDMPHVFEAVQEMEISRRIRSLEQEPSAFWDKSVLNKPIFNHADFNKYFVCEFKP